MHRETPPSLSFFLPPFSSLYVPIFIMNQANLSWSWFDLLPLFITWISFVWFISFNHSVIQCPLTFFCCFPLSAFLPPFFINSPWLPLLLTSFIRIKMYYCSTRNHIHSWCYNYSTLLDLFITHLSLKALKSNGHTQITKWKPFVLAKQLNCFRIKRINKPRGDRPVKDVEHNVLLSSFFSFLICISVSCKKVICKWNRNWTGILEDSFKRPSVKWSDQVLYDRPSADTQHPWKVNVQTSLLSLTLILIHVRIRLLSIIHHHQHLIQSSKPSTITPG